MPFKIKAYKLGPMRGADDLYKALVTESAEGEAPVPCGPLPNAAG